MSTLRKQLAVLVLGAALSLSVTACNNSGSGIVDPNDPSYNPGGGGTNDPYNPGGGGSYNPTPTPGGGGIFNPGGGGGQMPVQITASVSEKKTSGILFWKKLSQVTVQLQNPSTQNVSGRVTVTFTRKGSQVETQDQPFTLAGGQSTTLTIKPTKSSDDAVATAQSDTPGTGSGGFPGGGGSYPGGGGYGNGTGYGGGYGNGTGSGYGNGTGSGYGSFPSTTR